MSREIKFRGMRIDNNDFEIGNLITEVTAVYCEVVRTFINNRISNKVFNGNNLGGIVTLTEVNVETVGEYTGVCDENHCKEIFEGDICKFNSSMPMSDVPDGFIGIVKMQDGVWTVDNGKESHLLYRELFEFEVIGNIHQHSHLLELPK